ncbi:MAG: RAMP superfamily CRISPR-associated protein [Thermoguttaceae bacterium]
MPKPIDIPACPGTRATLSSVREMREYQIRQVMLMFGGGVEVGEPYPTLPVRGTSIRGQLQFWWRATRGASCSTREELFPRHAAVWGTTERASPGHLAPADVRNRLWQRRTILHLISMEQP